MKTLILLLPVLLALPSFAAETDTVLASCHAVSVSDENPSGPPNLVGQQRDVQIVQRQYLPYINDLDIEAAVTPGDITAIEFGGVIGLPLASDTSHRASVTDDGRVLQVSYCSKGFFFSCQPVSEFNYDQTSLKGDYTVFVKHCEPQESCLTEVRKFAISCDRPIHVANSAK